MKTLLLSVCIVVAFHISKAQTNTFPFPADGPVGIGTASPRATLDVGKVLTAGMLSSVLARLAEGDGTRDGTYLGIKGYSTQLDASNKQGKSFAIEHSFYGTTNNSINFFRGDDVTGGSISFNTNDNTEKMRIQSNGNVGVGTTSPRATLDVGRVLTSGMLSSVLARLAEGDGTLDGTYLGIKAYSTQLDDASNKGKSFAIEHSFYGITNNSINFFRGENATGGSISFNTSDNTEKMRIQNNGNVGIGTTDTKGYKLAVAGNMIAEQVTVKLQASWPDYVFKKDYTLTPLSEVKNYINQNHHLPDVPSEQQVQKDGINLGEMNAKLLKKIEELTLYMIEKEQQLIEQRKINQDLETRLERVEKQANNK